MKHLLLIVSVALVPLAACGSDDSTANASSSTSTGSQTEAAGVDPAQIKQGKQLFISLGCSACHGESGKGDGMAAAALDPKPRNYTDAAWQAATTDEHIKQVIMDGGAAHGLDGAMPAHEGRINSDEELAAIVAYIRSLG